MSQWKVAGINFDHFHMGDLLREVWEHPRCEIAGISDEHPERMQDCIAQFGISEECTFTDYRNCLEQTQPDLVILCPAAARHGEWTEKVAPFRVHLLMEKPFAASLKEADRMIAAMQKTGKQLAINWPLAWYPSHRTCKRLIDDGAIGEVIEYHFYDGNRGPLWHSADKIEKTSADVEREKPTSWFYNKEHGGGSLLDYAGYGTTLGTWLMNGRKPLEVTATVDQPPGLEVDEHAVIVARYKSGLSKIETRWGTFSDPWRHQPQPKCGFVVVGTQGTISSYDWEDTVRIQDEATPVGRVISVDNLPVEERGAIAYMIDCLEKETDVAGPLSLEIARIGQQIVDTAVQSARLKKTVTLLE